MAVSVDNRPSRLRAGLAAVLTILILVPAGMLERGRDGVRSRPQMPDDRRQVILLRFVDDLSTAEIAEVLDRSPGAVRVLLHRSLRELAARLDGQA